MKERTSYTEAFRKQALEKVYTRGRRTVKAVAEELNMNPWTLKNWMTSHKDQSTTKHVGSTKRPQDWSPAERLDLLLESHGLDEEALNAVCREKGIFRHHLQQWRSAFEAAPSPVKPSELRELKDTNKVLARELKRKEKALAEAAALLVLKKKYQTLWEDKDE
jgi:transposase-like protein